MCDLVEVRFEPGGETAEVPVGSTILEAAYKAGVHVVATCGGRGTCGKCGVRVLEGELGTPIQVESVAKLPRGVYLACLATVAGPLKIRALNVIRPPRAKSPDRL